LEDLALDALVFGRSLDHEIAVGEGGIVGRGPDALQRGVLVFFREPPARDLALQILRNDLQPGVKTLLTHIGDDDIEAGDGAYMGDAAPHLPGADDADP